MWTGNSQCYTKAWCLLAVRTQWKNDWWVDTLSWWSFWRFETHLSPTLQTVVLLFFPLSSLIFPHGHLNSPLYFCHTLIHCSALSKLEEWKMRISASFTSTLGDNILMPVIFHQNNAWWAGHLSTFKGSSIPILNPHSFEQHREKCLNVRAKKIILMGIGGLLPWENFKITAEKWKFCAISDKELWYCMTQKAQINFV